MTLDRNMDLLGVLPHELARRLFRLARPARYARITDLRDRPADDPAVPSLRPFLEQRCIFVHIPKCAGIGVTEALFAGVHPDRHFTLSHYKLAFSRDEFESFFKFTFVRNPWDRLVSAYYYLKGGGRGRPIDQALADRLIKPHASFRDFVLNFVTEENVERAYRLPGLADMQVREHHFRPQYSFVCFGRSGAPQVNFIGRFERLEEDFQEVCARLGRTATLRSSNRSKRRPSDYRDAYDAEMVARVEKAYRRDIELFGYEF
jgi:Sulfotransferase family